MFSAHFISSLAGFKSVLLTLLILGNLKSTSAMLPGRAHVKCGGGNTNENAPKILHPQPTAAHLDNLQMGQGFSPKPTKAPQLELLRRRGLLAERQENELVARDITFSSGELIAYSITDNTCGYISGSLGAPVTCPVGSNCGGLALYAIDGIPGAMFCCASLSALCTYATSCYNSAQVPSPCDVGCQANTDNVLCTNAASPYCVEYTWSDIHATSWGCAAATDSTAIVVDFTWLGEDDGRTWNSVLYTPTTGGSGPSSQSQGISILNTELSSSTTTSSATSSTSSGSNSGGGGGGGTNVGAIVGGVIGGLAVVGVAVIAVVFLLLRSRRQKQANAAAGPGAPGAGVVAAGGIPYDPNNPHGYQYVPQHQQHMSMLGVPGGFYSEADKPHMSATSPSDGSGPSPGTAYSHPVYQPPPTELDGAMFPGSAVGGVSTGGQGGNHLIHEVPGHSM